MYDFSHIQTSPQTTRQNTIKQYQNAQNGTFWGPDFAHARLYRLLCSGRTLQQSIFTTLCTHRCRALICFRDGLREVRAPAVERPRRTPGELHGEVPRRNLLRGIRVRPVEQEPPPPTRLLRPD